MGRTEVTNAQYEMFRPEHRKLRGKNNVSFNDDDAVVNVSYHHLANMKRLLLETDEWLRRRIRMCIWKAWKKVKTKVANLIICGINKYQAYEWGNTRKGYWRIADSYILHRAITNEHLCRAGYATLMDAYLEWYPK